MKHTAQQIEDLKRQLAEAPPLNPPDRGVSKLEAVRRMAPELQLLRRRRGYKLDDLLSLLRDKGLEIKRGTLKVYLRRIRWMRKLPTRRKRSPAAGAKVAEKLRQTSGANDGWDQADPTEVSK